MYSFQRGAEQASYYWLPGVLQFKAMQKTTTLTFLLALALAVPFPASAPARVIAPPGNAEADQYYQTVPSPTGPRVPDTTKKARDAVREGALTEATEQGLRHRGPTGLALATAVAQTALPGGPGGHGTALTVSVPDEQGLGALFLLILVAAGAAAIAFIVARRRGLVTR
jgi:hypothetical protein